PADSINHSRLAVIGFFFSSRRRHTRSKRDWSSDVCSSDLVYRLDTRSGEITGKLGLEGALAPAGPTIVYDSLMVPSQSRNVYVTPLDEFPAASAPEAPA